jgi:hypothetical protein
MFAGSASRLLRLHVLLMQTTVRLHGVSKMENMCVAKAFYVLDL